MDLEEGHRQTNLRRCSGVDPQAGGADPELEEMCGVDPLAGEAEESMKTRWWRSDTGSRSRGSG